MHQNVGRVMKTNILLGLIGLTLCAACGSNSEKSNRSDEAAKDTSKVRSVELVDSNGNCTEHYLEITETFLSDTKYTLDNEEIDSETKYKSLKLQCDRHLAITGNVDCLYTDEQTDTPGLSSNELQSTINKMCTDINAIDENI